VRALLGVAALAAAVVVAPASAATSSYIVVMRDGAVSSFAGTVEHRYTSVFNGFSARLTAAQLRALKADPNVSHVERDGIVHANSTQLDPPWGLDRIDQRARQLDNTYSYTNTGAGVTAYIIDTGIRFTHSEFGTRATSGFDAVDGGSADDCNGHGTHVSGTVGGSTYGVAKNVDLVAVRVLNCSGSGTWSGVIAGMDWVTANHVSPAVANMSLGGGANSSVDDAVRRMVGSGVATAIAAGNGNQAGRAQDACRYSPARVTEAMTVGATDQNDRKTSWSNYGTCVDWFAPGLSITSAWYTSNTATNTISGTSMATPHTAGVAALYLESNPLASPATVSTALAAATTKGIVANSKTAHNDLLFSNY